MRGLWAPGKLINLKVSNLSPETLIRLSAPFTSKFMLDEGGDNGEQQQEQRQQEEEQKQENQENESFSNRPLPSLYGLAKVFYLEIH